MEQKAKEMMISEISKSLDAQKGVPEWLSPEILSAMVTGFMGLLNLIANIFSKQQQNQKGLFDFGGELWKV